MCGHVCQGKLVGVRGLLTGVSSCPQHVGPRNPNQVVRLSISHLYLLSYLADLELVVLLFTFGFLGGACHPAPKLITHGVLVFLMNAQP